MVPWRQSASLILLGKKQANLSNGKSLFDYSTLLLKRSPKMRFAPDISAFPGGKLDPYDLSPEWPKYLSSLMNIDRFSQKNADIYKDIDHPYPGLAFRLCAIRETFEETGLLLAKSSSNSSYATITNLSKTDADQWREKIRQDASQFLVMCQQLRIQPDIHSLFEWAQYLAAAIAKVRFDTIFYVTPLSTIYPCTIADDDHETVSAEWLEPDTAMKAYEDSSLNFLPPQILELSRMTRFQKFDELVEYLSKRDKNVDHHTHQLLCICYKIPEALVLVMPGDDHYPLDASFTTPIISLNKTLKDFDSENQNRLIMLNKGDQRKWKIYRKTEGENVK